MQPFAGAELPMPPLERNRFACDGASRGDPISRPINPLGTYEAPQFYALK
jgi:hypothetical protein